MDRKEGLLENNSGVYKYNDMEEKLESLKKWTEIRKEKVRIVIERF